uniref:Uncharacterized protein n=1 Tax=Romanomermis culicivorax TaxID=13658 RepID=A0A915HVW7_ROMCU
MTPVVGQVAMLATTALLIGQNVYETIKEMNEFEALIPVTAWEYEYEGLRIFFHLGLDDNMKELINEVEANEILTNNILNTYPNFGRIITSAATLSHEGNRIVLIEDNDINLQVVHGISKTSRIMPRKNILPKNVELFCVMIEEYMQSHSGWFSEAIFLVTGLSELIHPIKLDSNNVTKDVFCRNAFGIKNNNKLNTTENTLFILGNGLDFVKGFLNSSNIFLLENGPKHIHGGNSNDTFIIQGSQMSGELHGGDGFDTIDFAAVDMDEDSKLLIKHGTVILKKDNRVIEFNFYNIENIIGRENSSDHVIVCNQTRIDLRGSLKSADNIFINNKYNCLKPDNLTIILRNNTRVSCSHWQAQVRYVVEKGIESYAILTAGNHYFEFQSLAFSDVIIRKEKKKLLFQDTETNLTIKDAIDCKLNVKFSDNVLTEWNGDYLLAHLLGPEMSLNKVIEKYFQCLHNNPLVKFYAATHSGTFVWDYNHFLVMHNGSERLLKVISNKYENDLILVGHNAAENYFLITADPEESIDHTIYVNASAIFPCHIDLHNIAREIHWSSNGSHGLLSTSHQISEDIVLELFAVPNNVNDDIPDHKYLGKLILSHGMNYLDNIILYLYQKNSIIYESNELFIKPHPIRADNTTIVILPGNFEFFGEVFLHGEHDNLEIYSLDKSLIITNAASLENSGNFISVALVDYFSYRNKFRTLKLSFGDRVLSWKANAELIDTADNISSMWTKIDVKLNNSSLYEQQEKYVVLIEADEWDCQLFNIYNILADDNQCLYKRKKLIKSA